jgi:hypothetical protein
MWVIVCRFRYGPAVHGSNPRCSPKAVLTVFLAVVLSLQLHFNSSVSVNQKVTMKHTPNTIHSVRRVASYKQPLGQHQPSTEHKAVGCHRT